MLFILTLIGLAQTIKCPKHKFNCKDKSDCIEKYNVCNLVEDCHDGSDELNCHCYDYKHNCYTLYQYGYCKYYPSYMIHNCPHSCDFCDILTTKDTTLSSTTKTTTSNTISSTTKTLSSTTKTVSSTTKTVSSTTKTTSSTTKTTTNNRKTTSSTIITTNLENKLFPTTKSNYDFNNIIHYNKSGKKVNNTKYIVIIVILIVFIIVILWYVKKNKKKNDITILNDKYLDTEYEEMRNNQTKHLEIDNPTYLIPENKISDAIVDYEEIESTDSPTYLIPGIPVNNNQIEYEEIN